MSLRFALQFEESVMCIFINYRRIPLDASECTEEELNEESKNNNPIKCAEKIWSNVLSFIFLAMKGIHMANQRGSVTGLFADWH